MSSRAPANERPQGGGTGRGHEPEDRPGDTNVPDRREPGPLYRKMGGEAIDSDLEWAIVDSLDGCAAKTHEVELMLWRIDPETARYFLRPPNLATANLQ